MKVTGKCMEMEKCCALLPMVLLLSHIRDLQSGVIPCWMTEARFSLPLLPFIPPTPLTSHPFYNAVFA